MQKIFEKIKAPWPSVILTATVLYLTLSPRPLPPQLLPSFFGWDKVAHFFMFGILCATIMYDSFRLSSRSEGIRPAVGALIIAAVVALGGAIELLQGTSLINRACDLPDFVANTCGAVTLGVATYLYCHKYWKSAR